MTPIERSHLKRRVPRRQIGLVLWNGDIGGAEVFSLSLAERMRQFGVDTSMVFINHPYPLLARASSPKVPTRSLGLRRGRNALLHPRRYAADVARVSRDGVLLVDCGFMAAGLRAGGYRGPVVAVEHGAYLDTHREARLRQALRWLGRAGGGWANDIEVAVSDFILSDMMTRPHARVVRRIYNGVDRRQYNSTSNTEHAIRNGEVCVVAFAGRLVRGKGADYLLRAVARLGTDSMRLLIAGDGPEREHLERLSVSLGVRPTVEFLGRVDNMPAFWQSCDIAVIPSAEFVEACPMTALEAMAAGRPVIASLNGGLPELVVDGATGALVAPADHRALADALHLYINDQALRILHGSAGEARVAQHFCLDTCAQAYIALFDELGLKDRVDPRERASGLLRVLSAVMQYRVTTRAP